MVCHFAPIFLLEYRVFHTNFWNVSCECDRLNVFNSTLQAAWYIRHIDWACVRWQGRDTEYPLTALPIQLVLGVAHFSWASEDVREEQLYYSQSRDGIWDMGPSLVSFMIIPNTKHHPNNNKMDQFHIFGVITCLTWLYLNISPPWWVTYADKWEIRGNPGSTN